MMLRFALVGVLVHGVALQAQQPSAAAGTTRTREARDRIGTALQALGGEQRVRAIRTLEIQGTGAEFRTGRRAPVAVR